MSNEEQKKHDQSEAPGVVDLSAEADLDPQSIYAEIDQDGNDGAAKDAAEAGGVDVVPRAEYEALHEKYLRTLADLDNMRKRMLREKLDMQKFGHEQVVRELLPVLDNLERAVAAAPPDAEGELRQFIDGVQMIIEQFVQALERHGVKGIDALGATFNPEVHEALSEQPSEEHPPGTVLHQMEKGYHLHDRLLRPARVVVSRRTPESD
ncbi:MAG: nucleotide exchange factor GrpE [Candidatus Dadabacteria bacterium]|nr:MAG: nucleotide exchange factor GrpE [Candidatus Dadabacteria bacterium]